MRGDLRAALTRTDLPRETVAQLRRANDIIERDSQAHLLSFMMHGDRPLLVISFGDTATADLVVYLLHGTATALEALPGWADAGQRLCVDVIRTCVARGEPRSIACVVWFGWDPGVHATVLETRHATIGAAALSTDLDRLAARNPGAHIAVVTYSYSTTLLGEMYALRMAERIDTAVSLASAGVTAAAASAIEEAIDERAVVVHATEGAGDTTAPLGRLGAHPIDPRDIDGVHVFSCDGGPAPGVDGRVVTGVGVSGHSSQSWTDERGVRHPGYFDAAGQGYLSLVSLLADAVTTPR